MFIQDFSFIKQICVDMGTFIVSFCICKQLSMRGLIYYYWLVLAVEVFLIWFFIISIVNLVFYRSYIIAVTSKILRKITEKHNVI